MANLKSLIKLRRHNVDEKQKLLAGLYREVEEIERGKTMLIDRLRSERKVLDDAGTLEMYAYFGRFSQNIHRMIERLNEEKSKLEMRIRIAQDDVREAFANMKRIEIVQREREKAEKKEADDKEARELDEIGIEGFRRKEDENI
ncbi:MAG: flagellar FliJ family protein [Micavibrio sp.]